MLVVSVWARQNGAYDEIEVIQGVRVLLIYVEIAVEGSFDGFQLGKYRQWLQEAVEVVDGGL